MVLQELSQIEMRVCILWINAKCGSVVTLRLFVPTQFGGEESPEVKVGVEITRVDPQSLSIMSLRLIAPS